ncbi:TrbC/VirB2 family protein [Photobacterium toruni]|uniref:TrbC/VirB2 family protein n=1 Tax=Photobacterium toruni TaxID=1935446 RepID=UPI002E19AF58|nr:TrbC/VirB2 family protein [Photobacterium toruni]
MNNTFKNNTPTAFTASKNMNLFLFIIIATCMMLFPDMAHAAGGLDKINGFMENLKGILSGAAIVTVTVAVMWVGYKVVFTEWDARECGKILMGGLFIGGGAEIAGYLVG